jgi:SAM-dependent methyltransferase
VTGHPDDVVHETTYDYFARDDVVAEYASFDFVLWPEQRIFEELRDRLASSRVLDIGVGAGRTTLRLAPLAAEYVGIDTSEKMIDACRERFGRAPDGPRFAVADIRDLRGFEDDSFDLVLFSFNGIDTVGDDEDRSRSLHEIHRVTRAGGLYCFSSHNLAFALEGFSAIRSVIKLFATRPAVAVRHPKEVARVARAARRWGGINGARRELSRRGRGLVVEDRPRHEFSSEFYDSDDTIRVEKYYIDLDVQRRELDAAGFGKIRVFTPDGAEATAASSRRLSRNWWIYYLCEKLGPDGSATTGASRSG